LFFADRYFTGNNTPFTREEIEEMELEDKVWDSLHAYGLDKDSILDFFDQTQFDHNELLEMNENELEEEILLVLSPDAYYSKFFK
jgi:hypothetical protein